MNNLANNVKLTLVNAAAVSAGTAINTTSVDMTGYDGVCFFGSVATYNASNVVNIAQSADDSSFADLEGSDNLPSASTYAFFTDIYKPTDRYVRCEIARSGANTAVGDIYAIQYGSLELPVTQPTATEVLTLASPAEGTA